MVIRQEQMEALQRNADARFQDRLLEHVKSQFPGVCGGLSTTDLQGRVQDGIERARQHGLDTEQQIAFFVDLMFLFGWNFDQDPRLPWAAEILASDYYGDTRIEMLYQRGGQDLREGQAAAT